jgi:hypothetical protein
MDENVKAWHCPHGHVMGLVTRDGRGVRRLLLYRLAMHNWADHDPPLQDDEIDVIATIEGYVSDVRCSICGGIRTWVPGEEALKIVLERLNVGAGLDLPVQNTDGG